ncbi:zinc metallohydrolase glyoxalase II family protein [Iodidimonas gelatinilytica]|uniref:Zinc metallohydrolase glyoxalase II family protein n=1 Tax=Iodidimonas gelatinilytica TaxID=1236966 RepID=A0A5A7MT88_9PROT|nr:MBL fold metallo-hydrolase [Iodidimonas gelatinilytica]GEQ98069.1 zinc metallohydrolase glyoxalase II family protein [Iodidimonas gelatinilytica]
MSDPEILTENDTASERPPDPDHRLGVPDDGDGLRYPMEAVPEPGTMLEVADGLYWVRMPLPWSLDHINLYLIDDGVADQGGWALVDSGVRSDEAMDHWRTIFTERLGGRPISHMIVTHHHPDHLGLAGWIADEFSAPIHATRSAYFLARSLLLDVREEAPQEALDFSRRAGFTPEMVEKVRVGGWGNFSRIVWPLPVGYRSMAGGDVIRLGDTDWHIIETAGHAPGHACLYSPERGILLSGDQVLPRISSNVSVYPTEPYGNPLEEWLVGLARLRALPKDILVLPSHNEPFYGLVARLDALIGKHVSRLNGVVDLCATPRSAVEVFPALFRRRVRGMEFAMATGEAIAHLHFLEALGVVARRERDGVTRFERIADYDEAGLRARLAAITEEERERAPWKA